MNASPLIDTENCRTCGKCCKEYRLFYPDGLHRDKYDDLIRIMYLEGVKAHIEREDKGVWLVFDHVCKFLRKVEGRYSCTIYDDPTRPKICEKYPYPDITKDCPHMVRREISRIKIA